MGVFEYLVLLAILVYFVNVIPVFMPPTWTILAFCFINFHLPFVPAVIISAVFATCGRITLYYISKTKFRRLLSQKYLSNYDALGDFFKKQQRLTIPIFLTYAFFPISSNYVYIAAGLAKIDIKILALSFLVGRLFSYSLWTTTSSIVFTKLEDIFSSQLANIWIAVLQIIGLLIIVAIGKINWVKILKK